jgi:uncharacterized protein (TIGR01777 family)
VTPQHIVIAGGSGFLGRALVPALLARGAQVTVASRSPHGSVPAGARLAAYDELPRDPSAVVNLAGANVAGRRWTAAYKRELVSSRVDFTRDLAASLAGGGRRPPVWIQASAVGIYGDHGTSVITEATPPGEGFLPELCRAWEAAAAAAGDRVVVLRFGIALGRGGGALAKMEPPFRCFVGGPLGSGRQYVPWITREDLVRMVVWALEGGDARGAYNATAPEPCTNAELSRALARALRRPCWLPVPAPLLRAVLGEAAQALLASQRVLPARALAEGFTFAQRACGPALAALYARTHG